MRPLPFILLPTLLALAATACDIKPEPWSPGDMSATSPLKPLPWVPQIADTWLGTLTVAWDGVKEPEEFLFRMSVKPPVYDAGVWRFVASASAEDYPADMSEACHYDGIVQGVVDSGAPHRLFFTFEGGALGGHDIYLKLTTVGDAVPLTSLLIVPCKAAKCRGPKPRGSRKRPMRKPPRRA